MTQDQTKTYAYRGLATLTLLNLFNYIDRYVVAALVETLKKSELQLSDAQAGLLMTAFVAVYTLAFPLFGLLSGRIARPKLLAIGVLLWSLATMLSGLAPNFPLLLLCRGLVGVGEAAYVTIAPTLIADYFASAKRGQAFAIFYAALPIGSAIGYILGGVLDTHFGWRSAFLFTGGPGLVLALLALRLQDPGEAPKEAGVKAPTLSSLWRDKAYLLSSFGYGAYAFGLGGLAFWMPAYMERLRGTSHEEAATLTGAFVVVTGFIGTFIGGFVADRLRRRYAEADLMVCWISVAIATPLVTLALFTPSAPVFWVALVLAELAIFVSSGPINGAIIGILPPALRAMGLAVSNVITHVVGDVPSPPLIGWISDGGSLLDGMTLIPVAFLICTGLWWLATVMAKKRRHALN